MLPIRMPAHGEADGAIQPDSHLKGRMGGIGGLGKLVLDAGIVVGGIDPAEVRDGLRDHRLDLRIVGDIAAYGDGRVALPDSKNGLVRPSCVRGSLYPNGRPCAAPARNHLGLSLSSEVPYGSVSEGSTLAVTAESGDDIDHDRSPNTVSSAAPSPGRCGMPGTAPVRPNQIRAKARSGLTVRFARCDAPFALCFVPRPL